MRQSLHALLGLLLIANCGAASAQGSGNKVITTPNAPEAIGPYSQAIRAGKTV